MLQADIYNFHNNRYIVIDTNDITMDSCGMARLANYEKGVGAECIILVDRIQGQAVAACDARGHRIMIGLDEYKVASVALGQAEQTADMYHIELRITEYFQQKLVAAGIREKIAG